MVGLIMTTDTRTFSTETLFQSLAHPRRRTILHHLVENGDETVALDELTETIATDGGTATISHESDDTRTRVELHHVHLPKLAAAGIIEYDADRHTVQYRASVQVETLLEFVSTDLENRQN